MRKVVFLSLIAFIFILPEQSAAQISGDTVSVPDSSVKKEAEDRNNNADKKKLNTKDEGKTEKSVVNVSPRFRDKIAPEKLQPVKIPRFDTAPIIDGKLDDAVWKQAAVFKDFYQTSPGDNIAPSKPTVAYIGYDSENLYLAFYCYDEPDKIRATVAKRDNVFNEDNVRVHLDTYDDQRRAYVLGFNPLGIQQDGIYTEGQQQGPDFSVDIVMESKGAIIQDGWTLEVKIPFKSLRYSIGKGKNWGIHLSRNIDRLNDEFDSWMPQDKNIVSWLAQEGKITGLENIKVERTLEIVPSITLSETGSRRRTILQSTVDNLPPGAVIDTGRFVNAGIKQDIGVNLKFNVTPNVTLDMAYNPDYAEIEADAPVVAANQRFPIFFQEKRPFFLEGADIFNAPLQTFYSRTIIDPDIAAKLTGKIGRNTFGFLVASDNAPGNYSEEERSDPLIRARINEFLDKNALFGVVRVKRDIGKENNIGFFGTLRLFPEQRNFTGGFDGRFKLNPKTTLVFQAIGTHSRRCFFDSDFESALNPEQAARNRAVCGSYFSSGRNSFYRAGNGLGYYLSLDYTEKNRGLFLETFGRSKDYRADAGFTPRVDTNTVFFANRISTEPKPKAKLIRVDWRQFGRLNYDWKGRSQSGFVGTHFNLTLQGNTFVFLEFGLGYERLFEEEFGLKRTIRRQGAFFGAAERSAYQPYIYTEFRKTVSKKLSVSGVFGASRNSFDFDFGGGSRFPRVSPAYLAYLSSPAYLDYLRLRALNPQDPNNYPPASPPLDPGTGGQIDLKAGFEYKPVDALRVSLDYTKSKLTRFDTGKTAFDANILTLRSTYQFTRFIFARTRIDYNSLSSNVSGQALFGWNPNPGTALYVGYNDNFNYNGFNPYTGQLEPRFERNSRTFFIRASYLFRKSF